MLRATIAMATAIAILILTVSAVGDSGTSGASGSTPLHASMPTARADSSPSGRGFTANLGQMAPNDVRFYSSSSSFQVGFAPGAVLFAMHEGRDRSHVAFVRAVFDHANPTEPIGVGRLSYSSNFLMGPDSSRTRLHVPSYHEVAYRGLYDGIDLVFSSVEAGTKYDFLLAPGAAVEDIGIHFEGAQSLRLDAAGELLIETAAGTFVDGAPSGEQSGRAVGCMFEIRDLFTVGYDCIDANPDQPLRIDPLIYATYLGSEGVDDAEAIARDASGNVYVTGYAGGADFPTTPGAFDRTFHGGCDPLSCADVFVAKLNPSGSALVYATFLGGSGIDRAHSIALDSSGNAYVTGETTSSDFPTTAGAFDRTYHGASDAFVVKLNAAGDALIFSTLLGGALEDHSSSIALDSAGAIYVGGHTLSSDFPTTIGAYNRTFSENAAFAAKLSSDGSSLTYSTFIGDGQAHAVVVDAGGNLVVGGETTIFRFFPTTPGAFQTAPSLMDGFVTKLNPTGSGLVYSTLLGGVRYDYIYAMALDTAGNAFLTGTTNSSDFPVTPGAWNTTFPGSTRGGYVYVAELNASGTSLNYATFIGGTGGSSAGYGVAVDAAGAAFVVGTTIDVDFPTTSGAIQPTHPGDPLTMNAFVSQLNPTGSTLLSSTYLGGSGGDRAQSALLDGSGELYVSGQTSSADFPVTPGAFDTSPHVNATSQTIDDGFVVKLSGLTGPVSYKTAVDTGPSGLRLEVNGSAVTTPSSFWCPNGATVWLNATSPQLSGSYQYWFSSWSDGGARDHTIQCAPGLSFTAYYTTTPQPDFVLLASPSRTSTAPGGNATVDLTVLALNGYAGSIVDLFLSGAPPGVAGTFSPTFVAPSGTATLALSVSTAVAPGVYPLVIRGNNGTSIRSVPFQLEVLGLQLAANATVLSIEAGSIGSATVTVTLKGNYTNPVVLSVSGLPAGVGVSVTTAEFLATGVATMTFIVASNAPTGTFPVAVTAAGGGTSRAVSLDLQILAGGGTGRGLSPGTTDWTSLLGWFVGASALAAVAIYLVERRKR